MILAKGENLFIRSLEPPDGKVFAQMAQDGSLQEIGFDKECYKWMDNWIKETTELNNENNPLKEYLAYAVVEEKTGKVIGSVGCSYYDDLDAIGICYFIGSEYRNRGYAVEAAGLYLQYFFDNYDVSQIIATIKDGNTASWKVAERIGFELIDKRNYKDSNDECEESYRFYRKIR